MTAGGSWFDPIHEAVTGYADAVLESGAEAGAGVMAHLASALARLQALPDEAGAAVADLTGALGALFPDAMPLAPDPRSPAACPDASGQAGLVSVTLWRDPATPLRRQRIDTAGLARFLREQHPHKPAEHAAARTGVPLDTVLKLLKRETLPVGRTMLAFIVAYGPELLAAVLPDADARWLAGARILADQARLEAELERTRAEMAANANRWSFCGISFGGAV